MVRESSPPLVVCCGNTLIRRVKLAELDSALLPAGSVHVERLMVYRAHCYRQLGQVSAALSLYEEAYQAARLRGFGQSYPLRGALWCTVLEAVQSGTTAEFDSKVDGYLEQLWDFDDPYSLGLGLLAAAWLERRRGDESTAREHRREAARHFETRGFDAGAAWCRDETSEEPVSVKVPSVDRSENPLPACDQWLGDAELEDRAERRADARDAFERYDLKAARQWMGVFL